MHFECVNISDPNFFCASDEDKRIRIFVLFEEYLFEKSVRLALPKAEKKADTSPKVYTFERSAKICTTLDSNGRNFV